MWHIDHATNQGIFTSGVFYECIHQGFPFSLAGSNRDDGPLPDTQMEFFKAQAEYTQLSQSAAILLMLPSMLHSWNRQHDLGRRQKGLCRC